jgi:hypothetical protein
VVSKRARVKEDSPYTHVIDIVHRIQTHSVDAIVSIVSVSHNDAGQVARLMASTL